MTKRQKYISMMFFLLTLSVLDFANGRFYIGSITGILAIIYTIVYIREKIKR